MSRAESRSASNSGSFAGRLGALVDEAALDIAQRPLQLPVGKGRAAFCLKAGEVAWGDMGRGLARMGVEGEGSQDRPSVGL